MIKVSKNELWIYFIIMVCIIIFLLLAMESNRNLRQNLLNCNQDFVSEYSNLKECKATRKICYDVVIDLEQQIDEINQMKNYTETDSIKPDESLICPTEKCKKIGYSCLQIYDLNNIPYAFQCVPKMIID